jgi:hypothetical protein
VLELASNVAGGTSGHFTFEFNYAGKLASPQGGTFNIYPAVNGTGGGAGSSTSYVHHTDDNSVAMNGLPFAVVAEQASAPLLVQTN